MKATNGPKATGAQCATGILESPVTKTGIQHGPRQRQKKPLGHWPGPPKRQEAVGGLYVDLLSCCTKFINTTQIPEQTGRKAYNHVIADKAIYCL